MKKCLIGITILFLCCSWIPFWKNQNKTIYVSGIGCTQNDLLVVKKILNKYSNFNVIVNKAISNTKLQVYENSDGKYIFTDDFQKIMSKKVRFDYDVEEPITIYVSRFTLKNNSINVHGLSYGNQIYIKFHPYCEGLTSLTLIHEISHNFGLSHCTNKCIMGEFGYMKWENTYYYCDKCRPNKPDMIKNVR
jgi:hypothetical protein